MIKVRHHAPQLSLKLNSLNGNIIALFWLLVFILIPCISNAEIKTYIHRVKQSFGGSHPGKKVKAWTAK